MSKFTDSELVLVGGRELPTLAGRLRAAHADNEKLSVRTEIVDYVLGVHAVVRAEVTTAKGTYAATGVATAARDPKLVECLLEAAESKAIARSLRWSGPGHEIGVEELGEAAFAANAVPDARGPATPAPLGRLNAVEDGGRRPRRGGTPATAAQRRCIDALARRVHVDPGALVARFAPGFTLDDLSLPEASRVIDAAKRTAGSNGSNGSRGTNGEGR